MRTWEIAKILVENCASPEDVDQVIQLLNSAVEVQGICSMLTSFSSDRPLSPARIVGAKRNRQASSHSSQPESWKASELAGGQRVNEYSDIAQAFQLETLLRGSGKTNKQIEQWMRESFDVNAVVGKGSLRLYLARVLRKADPGLRNQMMAAAQRMAGNDMSGTSDIKDYWDELEKRYIPSDVNDG